MKSINNYIKKVALIGSFRKPENYKLIKDIIKLIEAQKIFVVSPMGSDVNAKRDDFVIFETDNKNFSNEKIQFDTITKIFSSNAVYVINVNGYIGKTTSYEIGRIIEKKIPLYFIEYPKDLPICVSKEQIVKPKEFIRIIQYSKEKFIDFSCDDCDNFQQCISKGDL